MPYIKLENRVDLAKHQRSAETAGELNYQMTVLAITYMNSHGLSYQTCNDVVGAFDNAKDEFKRRIQNPYEDKKITENGDVY
jgi:hypothetical protein